VSPSKVLLPMYQYLRNSSLSNGIA